jgi:hypothetical protein
MPRVNTFEDAIKVAIQHYWDDNTEDDTPSLSKLGVKRKYTKKYFNQVADESLPSKDVKTVKPKP